MAKNKREDLRRIVRLPVAILTADNTILCICTMVDVSAGGARLTIESEIAVPDMFVLLLSKNCKVRRSCKVLRRAANEIGVEFVAEPLYGKALTTITPPIESQPPPEVTVKVDVESQ